MRTDADRMKWLDSKRADYLFEARTKFGTVRPQLAMQDTYGPFVFCCFKSIEQCFWLFQTEEARDLFEKNFATSIDEHNRSNRISDSIR